MRSGFSKSVLAMVIFILLFLSASAFERSPNYQGVWQDTEDSDWGIDVNHQEDVIYAARFTYRENGQPIWWTSAMTERNPAE